jgi:hypothetical protein
MLDATLLAIFLIPVMYYVISGLRVLSRRWSNADGVGLGRDGRFILDQGQRFTGSGSRSCCSE